MKQENYRNKRKMNPITTALIANFFYVVVVLLIKVMRDVIGNSGNYNIIFGLFSFIAITAFLVLYNWMSFRYASEETNRGYVTYLILEMVPIVILSIISIIFTSVGTNGSFAANWNTMTFAIAPSLFWFLPYGILYHLFGKFLPIAVFMFICLIYMALAQFIGYIIGNKSRSYARQSEQRRLMEENRIIERQNQMVKQAPTQADVKQQQMDRKAQRDALRAAQRQKAQRENAKHFDNHDPLADMDQPAIIQTEAFSSITDEMIDEAVRNQKIKSAKEKTDARKQQKEKRWVVPGAKKKPTVSQNQRQQTTQISEELDEIRKKMDKKDQQ